MKTIAKMALVITISLMTFLALANQSSSDISSAQKQNAVKLAKEFNQLFWNAENVERGLALLSDNFSVQEPSTQFQLKPLPKEVAAEKRDKLAKMMPGLKYKIDQVIVADDFVVLFTEGQFTHTRVVKTKVGIAAPTGQRIKYKTVMKYRIQDGKISEMYLLYDMFSRDVQMGLYPDLIARRR